MTIRHSGTARWLRLVPLGILSLVAVPTSLSSETETAPTSAPALFNLGNALFREGRLGEAILNYQRASLLAPGDPDISANLRLARSKAGIWAENPSTRDRLVRAFSLNQWGAIAATALFAAALGLPLGLLLPRWRAFLRLAQAIALPTLAVSLVAIALSWPDLDRAVAVLPEVVARISPAPAGAVVFHLTEGETAHVECHHGEYTLVRNRDGQAGWVKTAEVVPVIPRRSGA